MKRSSPFPPEGSGSGRERAYIRIGLGDASWIGSFDIGHTKIGSISLMPDNKHLFVSAKGAGYIIDVKSHTLVEQIGTHVAFVWTDARRTRFMVDHNGMSLEMFGGTGRLLENRHRRQFHRKTYPRRCLPRFAGAAPEDFERYRSKTTGEVRFEDAV